jgi:hypothetical protein
MRVVGFLLAMSSLSAVANTHPDLNGQWVGQGQYQATVNGHIETAAHAVPNLSISIDPMGKVSGSSPENGCRFLGIAAPGAMPSILKLDVTLSGCHYAAFNRRFTGTLLYNAKERYGALSLQSISVGLGRDTASFDIRATLRR